MVKQYKVYFKRLVKVGNAFYVLVPQRFFKQIKSKKYKDVLVEEHEGSMILREIPKENLKEMNKGGSKK